MATPEASVPGRGSALNARFSTWLDKRIPPARRHVLTQKNVFIFPNSTGFAFGTFIVLLVIGAINYQSSLIFAVAFLLASIFLVTILHTFRNLAGLTIEFVGSRSGFAGEDIEFRVRVRRPARRRREGIQLGWPTSIKQSSNLYDGAASTVKLYVASDRRGWLDPGRLLIETFYPLGILRAWTWVDLAAEALVFPKPLFEEVESAAAEGRKEGAAAVRGGNDDLAEIRDYRLGDSVRQIMWRSYARSDKLHVGEHERTVSDEFWLDYDSVAGDAERRLSVLTGLAITAHRAERPFGLKLGGLRIDPDSGPVHYDTVLRSLASYGVSPQHAAE